MKSGGTVGTIGFILSALVAACGDDAGTRAAGSGSGGQGGEATSDTSSEASSGSGGEASSSGSGVTGSGGGSASTSTGGPIPSTRPELVDYVCTHLAGCSQDGWSATLLGACQAFLADARSEPCRNDAVTSYLACLAPIDCNGDDFDARAACEAAYQAATTSCPVVVDAEPPTDFCSANMTVCGEDQGEVDECDAGCAAAGLDAEACAYGYCFAVAGTCDGSDGGEVTWLCVEERGLLED